MLRSPYRSLHDACRRLVGPFLAIVVTALLASPVEGKQKIRGSFFAVYPGAVSSVLDTVPSSANHCGACHYDFNGGGARNLYGQRLEAELQLNPNTEQGRQDAIRAIESEDPDLDGFDTITEITDTVTFVNTPTFPGYTPNDMSQVTNVTVADIQNNLIPSTGGDITPPDVTVLFPNGGEVVVGNTGSTVMWSATDDTGVSGVSLYVSLDNGATFQIVALGLPNTGSHTWYAANRPTSQAIFRVVAVDPSFNTGQDDSDSAFTVQSPPGGAAPTTLRDFDQPGSQPHEAGILNPPTACDNCHGNYDRQVEPYFNWEGSMMAQASIDPLFEACMTIANQDAPDSGDLCLRCHLPRGWLDGRSVPTDGSQMLTTDMSGVACDLCHRLVDPYYVPGNPIEDIPILAGLSLPPDDLGNGMFVVDPTGARRGPFLDATSGHPILVSPFHTEAALCGTCHDVSNPVFENDGNGTFVPNTFDQMADDFDADDLFPLERTYSEWFYSAYNTPGGVYAPQFGGNKSYVGSCQDCHMRDVTGQGANFGNPPVRNDLPLHDMTGGSTWLPGVLDVLHPGVNKAALRRGIRRARYMLQNAATVELEKAGGQLQVTVTNETGHKLPTGYPEGRRVWLNVQFHDLAGNLVAESGAYNFQTGELLTDPDLKVYEVKPGLDSTTAPLVGEPVGPSFHFALNNEVFQDNRIPPRGFTNSAYAKFGGAPVGATYADGQHWDTTAYGIPANTAYATVTLYYQSTSKEYVEFLRDKNVTDGKGQELYDLWSNHGKCPPEVMWSGRIALGGVGPRGGRSLR